MSEGEVQVQEAQPEQTQDTPTQERSAETEEKVSLTSEASAPEYGDEYEQKIEKLIRAHEEEQERSAETEEQKEEREEETLREGESWDSVFKDQPEDVQRAMQSLRADYTRKTQDVAKQRKELEAQQRILLESDVVKGLQEVAQDDGEEFDPFNPESFNKYVNKVVAEKLQSLLAPMQEAQQKAAAKAKVDNFMDAHPELKNNQEFRTEVKTLLLNNESLNLESAYWIAKGKRSAARKVVQSHEQKTTRERRKQMSTLVTSGARRSASTMPTNIREMNAWEIYESLKNQADRK
jgi:hypothetical protein